jgi:F-type H+-transporting ATPase subunit b
MSLQFRRALMIAAAAMTLLVPVRRVAHAENFVAQADAAPSGAPAVNENAPPPREEVEPADEKDQYRISYVTKLSGRILHISPKAAALLFEVLNFVILFGAIGWVLKKKLPVFLRGRSDRLQKQLVDSRAATEDANRRLHAIEERLAKLDTEIISMRQASEREVNHEEERFRDQLRADKERIVNQAEQEIDNVSHSARRELQRYAAELAVDTAQQRLHVTPEIDQKLIDEFLETLEGKQ